MARRMVAEKIYDRVAIDLPINSVVAVDIADDPYSYFDEKIRVVRSLRNDPLAGLKSRGFIDQCLYEAGRKWQSYLEAAQIGVISAIDPSKEAVDGGKIADPITDHQMAAIRALTAADRALGAEGAALTREVLAAGRTIKECAVRRDMTTKRGELYIGKRFNECLDTLALIFGLRTGRPGEKLTCHAKHL